MAKEQPAPTVSTITRPCTDHGWLRLPECDKPGMTLWELPCGCRFIAPKGFTPHIVTRRPV